MAKPRTKYFIKETYNRPVTKKEYFRIQEEKVVGDRVPQCKLLYMNVFTKKQIRLLIRKKVLFPVKYHRRIYFDRDGIERGIKCLSDHPRLFYI